MQLFSSWTGGDFLLFYAMMLAMGVLASLWMPISLRPEGRRSNSLDAEDAAMLAGGPERMADSVVADLFARGALAEAGSGKLSVIDSTIPATAAGKAVLSLPGSFDMKKTRAALSPHIDRLTARLRRQRLLVSTVELARLRWLAGAPLGVLFVLGLYRQRAGSAVGEPTEGLVALLAVTAVAAVIRIAKLDRRTQGGIDTFYAMRDQSERLRLAPRTDEAMLAVALFGTGVLIGTPWQPVHAMRQSGSDGGGSGDSSSDGDGGSGCGGGCGGCGG
ncbi:TIGR04222 domain-containing membrane protein [Erythrobacter sp. NFXS35]|uniref:TIGR04222 domain-containing membrane protein n=1 Tax=Erythrobacter sp. NFXS35 TaxID=2818436 RepID=UPI0032DE7F9F